jgi:hypothetical protein
VLNEERAASSNWSVSACNWPCVSKLLSVQQQGKWLEEQIAALATTQTDRGLVMTLGDVLFDTGEAELKNSANRTVLKIVQFLQLNPSAWCVSRATPTAPVASRKTSSCRVIVRNRWPMCWWTWDRRKAHSGRRLRRPIPGGRQRFRARSGAEPSGGNCVLRRKRPVGRRPLNAASLERAVPVCSG